MALAVQRVWTVSNVISASRIVFVVPAAYCLMQNFPHHRDWSVFFILVASSTDFLDGYFARRLHQVSDVGKIIDPLADKIGVGIIAVCLTLTGDIPIWYLAVLLARDLVIFVGGMYIKQQKRIVPQANMAGKIAVNVIALALLLSLMRLESLEIVRVVVLWMSVLSMVVSLVLYARRLSIGKSIAFKD